MARKMKNRMRETSAAPSAIPPNPNRAAMREMIRKTTAHFRSDVMVSSSLARAGGRRTRQMPEQSWCRGGEAVPRSVPGSVTRAGVAHRSPILLHLAGAVDAVGGVGDRFQ